MIRRFALSLGIGLAAATTRADLAAGLDAVERRDYAAARVEFEMPAQKGDPDAQVNLGNLYMRGWGVPQDYAAAFDWYRKAAEQNSRLAQGKLGVLHYYGLGTVKDSSEAARWFERAADQGDANAQSTLGTLYAQGDGVSRNLIKAYFWLTLGFEFGDTAANALRQQLAEEMTPGEISDALGRIDEWKRERAIPDAGGEPPEPDVPAVTAPSSRSKSGSKRRVHAKNPH